MNLLNGETLNVDYVLCCNTSGRFVKRYPGDDYTLVSAFSEAHGFKSIADARAWDNSDGFTIYKRTVTTRLERA